MVFDVVNGVVGESVFLNEGVCVGVGESVFHSSITSMNTMLLQSKMMLLQSNLPRCKVKSFYAK